MKNKKMISFIVIGRNEEWRLEKCFKGIYAFVKTESISDYEVIYVDSKSTDNSIELSKSFGNTKTILITGECNAAVARNIGAKEAKGEILFFIDGDMELVPGFWSSIVSNEKLVYPFVSGIEKDILHDKDWNYTYSRIRRDFKEGEDKYEVTTGGLFVIDAQLWDKVGGMDNRCKRSQDLDLGLRLTKIGYRLCRKPQIWVNHYTKDYEIRSDYTTFYKYYALLLRKHFFYGTALKCLFGSTYSLVVLLISCILMIAMKSFFSLFFYFVVIGYKTFRVCQRNKNLVNPLTSFFKLIGCDFLYIYYFFTFWPKDIKMEYLIK